MTQPHIALIGMMGTGKSTVGRALAHRLGMPLWDNDAVVVEREGRSIGEIFEVAGEDYFRERESTILREGLEALPPTVIALGGGALQRPDNRDVIVSRAFVVWLDASTATLVERLEGDRLRPLLQVASLPERIEALRMERLTHYQQAADVVISTDGASVEEIVESITFAFLRSRGPVIR